MYAEHDEQVALMKWWSFAHRLFGVSEQEYTLYAGTEQTIYALVDNAIVESAANDARREYLEWLER